MQPEQNGKEFYTILNTNKTWTLNELNPYCQQKYQIETEKQFKSFIQSITLQHDEDDAQEWLNLATKVDEFINNNSPKIEKFTGEISYKNVKESVHVLLASIEQNNSTCYLLSIEDFTLEEKVDKLNQHNQFINKLLLNMAHDIRTPLNTTSFLIEQSTKCIPQLQQQESLQVLKSNSKITMGRLNDLMNFYSLQSNQTINLNIEQFKISDLMQEIEDIIFIIAKMKNIKFSISKDPNLLNVIINSDKEKLLQILINLISNSLKFSPNGEIVLQILLTSQNILSCKVCDNGCGLSKDKKQKIKSEIFDFEILTNNNRNGIGLGLYISRQILPYLGPCKTFKIKSQVNKGSQFEFEIYVKAQVNINLNQKFNQQSNKNSSKIIQTNNNINSDDSLNQFSEEEIHQISTHIFQPSSNQLQFLNIQNKEAFNYQILIVDDQPFNIYVLKMLLLKMQQNYQICEAFDGQQAIKLFEQFNYMQSHNQIKLIFMDCQMPILNGFDATQQIKQKCQDKNYIPVNIVGYTSLLTSQEVSKCQSCGMNFWLQKPASFQQIKQIINQYYLEINCE